MSEYITTIGVEVHAELNSKSKAFCGCCNGYGASPNTFVCPVCMGLPGAVPAINKRAVELTIMAGLIFDCTILGKAMFERKSFFYPNLPKGYQICQYSMPLCIRGKVSLDNGKVVSINRIHLEEDSGKVIHDRESNKTYIDFNRSGVPLVEIVANPCVMTADETVEYITKLKKQLLFSGVSDCKIEEGGFRFDINISVNKVGANTLGTRVELINLSSFKETKSAIEYETSRQIELLEAGQPVLQETRVWSEDFGKTYTLRKKENVCDYRHIPDPDMKIVRITTEDISRIRDELPETYGSRVTRYRTLGLTDEQIEILTAEKEISDLFDKTYSITKEPINIANWIITEVLAIYNDKNRTDFMNIISPENLAEIIDMETSGAISRNNAKVLLEKAVETGRKVGTIAKELDVVGEVSDEEIIELVEQIISSHVNIVSDYYDDPEDVINYFVGRISSMTNGKARAERVIDLTKEYLSRI